MPEFTDAECELLIAMKLITLTRGAADAGAFAAYRGNPHTPSTTDWTEAFGTLERQGLLRRDNETWHLTEAGRVQAESVHCAFLERRARDYYRDRTQHIGPDTCN